MKTAKNILLITILIVSGAFIMNGYAQERSGRSGKQSHSRENKKHERHGYHYKEKHNSHTRYDYHGRHAHHHHNARVVRPVYSHQHRHDCDHRVIVHHKGPRYVYYSDYDVYFDMHRNVFISYAGRNWTISASLPVVLHRVDVRRVRSIAVQYYDDDFVAYLEHGRPMYGGVYASR